MKINLLWKGLGVLATLLPLWVQAAPPRPWIATADGSVPYSTRSSCVQAARNVLEEQGFVRVSTQDTSVMAAYRAGSDYRFKVAIKCLPSARSVVIFVVTTESRQGLNKANSLLRAMRSAQSLPAHESETMSATSAMSSNDNADDEEYAEDEPYDPEAYGDEFEEEPY